MASPTNFPYGPSQSPDNVTSLAAGAAKSLGSIGAAGVQMFDIVVAPMRLVTTGAATGTIEVYIACSETGGAGVWTDGISPTSTADQSALIFEARMGKSVSVEGAGTYYIDQWSVFPALGGGALPQFVCLFLFNKTGQPLGSTAGNFYLQYSQVLYNAPVPVGYA